jgi:predicted dehydrogenase
MPDLKLPHPAPHGDKPLRLAMLGMIDGNGHPYSWSAIVNGFNAAAMATCPYPVIGQYLGAAPGEVRIPNAQVTHLWTDKASEAPPVAAASLIPNIVKRPEDVIGQVDAVLISVDDGFDHVRRAKPFVEAGLPVFVDKPLACTVEELDTFLAWRKAGAKVLSSSGLRYAPEIEPLLTSRESLGEIRWIAGVACKTWERYGIHLLEPIYRILGPGLVSVRLEAQPQFDVAHILHKSGVQITIPVPYDGGGSFGVMQVCGTKGQVAFRFTDTYTAFRRQILSFIQYVRTGDDPYPFSETVELMEAIIAGRISREEKSRHVPLSEVHSSLKHL